MPAVQFGYIALEVIIVLSYVPHWEGYYKVVATAMLFAFIALENSCYYFAARSGQKQNDVNMRIARNRKYWDEYERLTPDPLFRSGIEVWVPPSLVSRTSDSRQHARNER